MIARRIDRKTKSDNHRALAFYIADASGGKNRTEKTCHSWYVGGDADNYWEGLIEVEATQGLNTHAKGSKTYHLIVSFRPEDEAKLTPQIFEDIEAIIAEALGFAEHQRHCGVHQNTDNRHLHIAYNKIHPEKLTCHTPYYDFKKLSQVCRIIEEKYCLAVDNGIEPGRPQTDGLANAQIKSIEAQSGQQSLFNYIIERKADIMAEIERATSWPEIHETFLKRGLLLKPSGNGLVIKDRYGRHQAKPSQIDRTLSKGKLVARFGPFQQATTEQLRTIKSLESYSAVPLHQGPERDGLYKIFQEEMKRRKDILAEINKSSSHRYSQIKDHWNNKRRELDKIPMLKSDRQRLQFKLREAEQAELLKMRTEMAEKRKQIRTEIPYTSWTKCLRHKAALGDETALAILRSKKEKVEPEKQTPTFNPLQILTTSKWHEKQRTIVEAKDISEQHRRALLAVVKMQEILAKETANGQTPPEITHHIDTKGTVIFQLPGGETIRDTGREIHFSSHAETKALAGKYAQAKWGRSATLKENMIENRSYKHYKQSQSKIQ